MDPAAPQVSPEKKSPSFFLLVAIVLLGGAFYYLWSQGLLSSLLGAKTQSGIYLSLVEKPRTKNFMGIYTFDPTSDKLSSFIAADPTKTTSYLTPAVSPDKKKIAFSSVKYPSDVLTSPTPTPGNPTLLIANANGSNPVEVALSPTITLVRTPVWSPDGTSLLFTARSDHEGVVTDIDTWFLYKYELASNKVTFLTNGTNPVFTSDGSILFLKNEGLYKGQVQEGGMTSELILPMSQASTLNRFTLSPDGNTIAMSFPSSSKVSVYKVSSWSPFEITSQDQISVRGVWPLFSPDGKQLAVIEEPPLGGDSQKNDNYPRLVTFDLTTKEKVSDFSLSKYDTDAIFMSEWRN